MANKIFCDKCKEEIRRPNGTSQLVVDGVCEDEYTDLCKKCTKEIEKIINK